MGAGVPAGSASQSGSRSRTLAITSETVSPYPPRDRPLRDASSLDVCRHHGRQVREEAIIGHRLVQQRFDFAPERLVLSTGFGEKRRALAGRPRERRVIQLLNALPAFRRHGAIAILVLFARAPDVAAACRVPDGRVWAGPCSVQPSGAFSRFLIRGNPGSAGETGSVLEILFERRTA